MSAKSKPSPEYTRLRRIQRGTYTHADLKADLDAADGALFRLRCYLTPEGDTSKASPEDLEACASLVHFLPDFCDELACADLALISVEEARSQGGKVPTPKLVEVMETRPDLVEAARVVLERPKLALVP